MTIQKLLEKCDEAYEENDFKRLIGLCDEVLEQDPDNQTATGYKSISCCFLNRPEKALELLDGPSRLHPKNHYFKNIQAMAHYDLGDYEKSLRCCEEGLEIKDFDWLYENKIKALLKLDRTDEAIECYQSAPEFIEITDLLIEAEKYSEALKYCLYEDPDDFRLIDKIKKADAGAVGDYYISWIQKIMYRSDIRHCPDCGGELVPIVWGYPGRDLMEREKRGEVFLGGCCIPINPPNYRCKSCGEGFDLGCEGLHIECDDYELRGYIEFKIRDLVSRLRGTSIIVVRSLEDLKGEMDAFDDEEFDAFIGRLTEIGYLSHPSEGYVKLEGFDDFRCAKEYPDEGKFFAPRWLAYPELSASSVIWRVGYGENYAMNSLTRSKEYEKLFPMPKNWEFIYCGGSRNPYPPIGFLWRGDGKPKYPKFSGGIEVNGFITPEDEGEFRSDMFTFRSIAHALELSKRVFLEKYPDLTDVWEDCRYSVLLNACYYKVMEDDGLKGKLLETGDEPLVYNSDDGENLFGRALMELRDEIRRICKNEDKIDWEFTEYLKQIPWC